MRNVIFFDVDGVLYEWFKPFVKFANRNGIQLRFQDLDGYHLENLPCWEDKAECYRMIEDFQKTTEWGNLPILTEPTVLHTLKNMGYELRVLSQVANPVAQRGRTVALSRDFGPVFSGIHYTLQGRPKLHWLVDFANSNKDTDVWLLDDKPATVLDIARYRCIRDTVSSRIHVVGINNAKDHPYLTKEMRAAAMHSRGEASFLPDTMHFLSLKLIEEYPNG